MSRKFQSDRPRPWTSKRSSGRRHSGCCAEPATDTGVVFNFCRLNCRLSSSASVVSPRALSLRERFSKLPRSRGRYNAKSQRLCRRLLRPRGAPRAKASRRSEMCSAYLNRLNCRGLAFSHSSAVSEAQQPGKHAKRRRCSARGRRRTSASGTPPYRPPLRNLVEIFAGLYAEGVVVTAFLATCWPTFDKLNISHHVTISVKSVIFSSNISRNEEQSHPNFTEQRRRRVDEEQLYY